MVKTDISELDIAIEQCTSRENIYGISICKDWIIPCSKVIKSGKCEVCQKFFEEIKRGENEQL